MSTPLEPAMIKVIAQYDSEQRYQYLLKQVVTAGEIWILTDQDGCVMLNTEDEDCIPVWPNEEFALAWANGEWAACKAQSIALSKWHSHWTNGLEGDDLAVVIFPNEHEAGLVVYPDELDAELKKAAKKKG